MSLRDESSLGATDSTREVRFALTAVLSRALLFASLIVSACGGKEDSTSSPEQTLVAVEMTDEPLQSPVEEAPVEPIGRQLLPIPPTRSFTEGEGGATVHRNEAVIVAGDMKLEIRANSSKKEQIISIRTMTPETLNRPMPSGLIVAAAQGTPHEPQLVPVARWHVPLMYQLEPRTELEALGWNPHLNSWAILGTASVNAAGTHAVFMTMMLGDVVFRVKPVRDQAVVDRCDGPNFRFKEEWPTNEVNAVGLTPVTERVARPEAFAFMSDFRIHESYDNVSFKNEEEQGAWHRNAVRGQSYRDEDYLMDPNAESAVTILQKLVADEWYDPYTGEAAMQVRLTEAYDSMVEHSQQSTHYQGRGIDLTLTPVPAPGAQSRRFWYGRLSRLSVCAGFDYVFYENNLHVHASVHPTRVAALVSDDDGKFGVMYGNLWSPERWTIHPHRWTAEELNPTSLAWTGWRTIEVRGESSTGEALFLNVETNGAERKPGTDFKPIRSTQTRLQALRVVDGRLYFVNAAAAPKLGSGKTQAHLLPIEAVSMVPTGNYNVIDAVFRPHDRSKEAWIQHGTPVTAPRTTIE